MHRHKNKKCEKCGINTTIISAFFNIKTLKKNLIEYKCFCLHRNYQKTFDENFKNRFANTHKFSCNNINNFTLLLSKDIYSYEYMDDWEMFNETSLPETKVFYSD